MQNRPVLILVGILGLLLVVAWITGLFESGTTTVAVPQTEWRSDDVSAIAVVDKKDTVRVVRDPDTWNLTRPVRAQADSSAVQRLLNDLGEMRLESVVTSDTASYGEYHVDSESASTLRLDMNGDVRVLMIGRSGPDFQSRYVRLGDDSRVFLASGLPQTTADLDRWHHKVIWDFPAESVRQVVVSTPGDDYSLSRSSGESWQFGGGPSLPADSVKVMAFLNRISTLRADGVLADVHRDSLASTHSIQIELVDGRSRRIQFESSGQQLAGASEEPVVWKFQTYRLSSLVPDRSDFTVQNGP